MALIREATLQRLQKRFGPKPDEGQAFLRRHTRVADGAGNRLVETLIGPLPARISFDAENRMTEHPIAGQPGAQHRYMVELTAYTEVYEKDELLWAGEPWAGARNVLKGTRRVATSVNPTTPALLRKFYIAQNEGITGTSEPAWPSALNGTVVDAGVTWKCMGQWAELQIIEIAEFDSYELTRDLYCDLRS